MDVKAKQKGGREDGKEMEEMRELRCEELID